MNITNDSVTSYINTFYEPLDDEMRELRAQSEEANIPLILQETEMFLGTLLHILKPENILEVGTAYGYSSIYFAKATGNANVTSIDISEEMLEVAHSNVMRTGLSDRVELILGEGADTITSLQPERNGRYDLVFLDAAKSHYRDFFDAALPLCDEGAVIVCDNILMKAMLVDNKYDRRRRHRTSVKRMKEFLNYLYSREDLSVSLLSCGDGLAVIKRI